MIVHKVPKDGDDSVGRRTAEGLEDRAAVRKLQDRRDNDPPPRFGFR